MGDVLRLKVSLHSSSPIVLPTNYNQVLQGFIYNYLGPELAAWLHDDAYMHVKRRYKLFTFSRLQGVYQLNPKDKTITFSSPVSFQLASHNGSVLSSFAEQLLKASTVQLNENRLIVSSIDVLESPTYSTPAIIQTLSPITTYSTFNKEDGRRVTHYYSPFDSDWSAMLLANLGRKAAALKWPSPDPHELQDARISAVKVSKRDRKILKYKNHVIEAWTGNFELVLPQGYFELALNTGLGSKNAQGFGMVEVRA